MGDSRKYPEECDYHISRDDIFDYHPIRDVIFILFYRKVDRLFSTVLCLPW